MQAFSCWHVYFDSVFLTCPLTVKKALYQDLKINSNIDPWPHLDSLPELPVIFSKLERFILTETNWMGCLIPEQEILEIQQKLNALMINLQCEKRYALQFWENSNRRIEASIVHFFMFFKMTIEACIPHDCQSILQANDRNKLIILVTQLQIFVNEILKALKVFYPFLGQQQFLQERQFTSQMLEDWIYFLINLPKLKRSDFLQIPKLMEYICIVNPLETNQNSPSENSQTRSRNITQVERQKNQHRPDKSQEKTILRKNKIDLRDKDLKRSVKWPHIESPIKNKLVIFKFKEKVRKYSVYLTKKRTIASIQTRDKTQISKSPKSDRSSAFLDSSMKLDKVRNCVHNRLCDTVVIERKSRQSSSKAKHQITKFKAAKMYQDEDIENQRKQKMPKKKKTQDLKVFIYSKQSSQIKIVSGRSKGWGIVKEWFKERLAARKLKKNLQN